MRSYSPAAFASLAIAIRKRVNALLCALDEPLRIAVQQIYHRVIELIMVPVRLDYGLFVGPFQRFRLAAFRVLRLLKPEYEESFDTAGLSLSGMDRWR